MIHILFLQNRNYKFTVTVNDSEVTFLSLTKFIVSQQNKKLFVKNSYTDVWELASKLESNQKLAFVISSSSAAAW